MLFQRWEAECAKLDGGCRYEIVPFHWYGLSAKAFDKDLVSPCVFSRSWQPPIRYLTSDVLFHSRLLSLMEEARASESG
jgi:hypothetical protein